MKQSTIIFLLALWAVGDATRIKRKDLNKVRAERDARAGVQEANGTDVSAWPWNMVNQKVQKICCCEIIKVGQGQSQSEKSQSCQWRAPLTLDTGSGCNYIGAVNWWSKDLYRRVSGIINNAGSQYKIFDLTLYGATMYNRGARKVMEQEYKTLCETISGAFVDKNFDTGSGKAERHWFLKIKPSLEKLFTKIKPSTFPRASQPLVKQIQQAAEDVQPQESEPEPAQLVLKKPAGQAKKAIESIDAGGEGEKMVQELDCIAMTKEQRKKQAKCKGKSMGRMVREADGARPPNRKDTLCPVLCTKWPDMNPLSRQTPKTGCAVVKKYRCKGTNRKKCKGGLKVAEKYCKNRCDGYYHHRRGYINGNCQKGKD